MKTFTDTIVLQTLEGDLLEVEVTMRTGPRHSETCGMCRQAFAEAISYVQSLNGAKFTRMSDVKLFRSHEGLLLVRENRIHSYPEYIKDMIAKNLDHIGRFADLTKLIIRIGGNEITHVFNYGE